MVLKDESSHQRSNSFPPSALILESPVRSQSNFSVKSDENTLEKELFASHSESVKETIVQDAITMQRQESIGVQQNNQIDEVEVTKEDIITDEVDQDDKKSEISVKSETKLLMMSNSSPNPGIKVTGTLKLMKPFEVSASKKKLFEDDDDKYEVGCFPKYLAAIWSTIFD